MGIVANLRPVKDHALFLRAAKVVAGQFDDVVACWRGAASYIRIFVTCRQSLAFAIAFSLLMAKAKSWIAWRECRLFAAIYLYRIAHFGQKRVEPRLMNTQGSPNCNGTRNYQCAP